MHVRIKRITIVLANLMLDINFDDIYHNEIKKNYTMQQKVKFDAVMNMCNRKMHSSFFCVR